MSATDNRAIPMTVIRIKNSQGTGCDFTDFQIAVIIGAKIKTADTVIMLTRVVRTSAIRFLNPKISLRNDMAGKYAPPSVGQALTLRQGDNPQSCANAIAISGFGEKRSVLTKC
jgi:hypothetical protein